jgi:MFS transporter, PPP family, 3-phenylpropionic acid transporter
MTASSGMMAPARLAFVTLFVAVAATAPFMPVYYESLGIDVRLIPVLGALLAGAGLIGSPLWGAAADRFSRSRLVLPAAALATAIAAVMLRLSGWPALVACVVLLGLATSGLGPILDARAIEAVGADRARYARLRVWGSASFVFGSVAVGALIERTSVGSLFLVYVPALLATAFIGLRLRPSNAPPQLRPMRRLDAVRAVVGTATLRPFLLAILVCWAASVAINSYYSIYLGQIGAPATLVGIAWAIGAAVEVPVMLAFPALARRAGIERLILAGAALLVVRAVLVATLHDPALVAATMALHGCGYALLLVGSVAFVAGHAPEGTAATAQGVLTATSYSLATVLGPLAAGLLATVVGLPVIFALAAAALLFGTLALGRVLLGRGAGSDGPGEMEAATTASLLSAIDVAPEPGPGSLTGS